LQGASEREVLRHFPPFHIRTVGHGIGRSPSYTQLTYFEVEPNCRFDAHSHASEQITPALEGELFFETTSGTARVGVSEVIAILANIHHAVYTKALGLKPIDA